MSFRCGFRTWPVVHQILCSAAFTFADKNFVIFVKKFMERYVATFLQFNILYAPASLSRRREHSVTPRAFCFLLLLPLCCFMNILLSEEGWCYYIYRSNIRGAKPGEGRRAMMEQGAWTFLLPWPLLPLCGRERRNVLWKEETLTLLRYCYKSSRIIQGDVFKWVYPDF